MAKLGELEINQIYDFF